MITLQYDGLQIVTKLSNFIKKMLIFYGGMFRTFIIFLLEIDIPCAQFNNLLGRNNNSCKRNIIPCERFDNP